MAVAAAAAATAGPCGAEVVFEPVPLSASWPGAVEPAALRLACARQEPELKELFEREGLPFHPDLLRRSDAGVCHVFYRPSVPGFRAAPDDDPVTGLLFDTDPLLYLAAGERNRGEPVGAMREILRRIERPLAVDILIHRVHEAAAYERATLRSFGGTPHRVTLLERGVGQTFWWVQDYVKAGAAGRGKILLVPRRIFEGNPQTGSDFEPLLARFAEREAVVRSRLSWEGGDLQFTRDPRDPARLVLFYGSFAKAYWAEALRQREFEYVLALEFGADRAVDLSGLAPHVDYFASFVPRAGLALVSVPASGDLAVARAAVDALLGRFAGREPQALVELRARLSPPRANPGEARQALERARRQMAEWQLDVDPTLPERMRSLVARVCPEGGDCLSSPNQLRLLETDPATFGEWVHATQSARSRPGSSRPTSTSSRASLTRCPRPSGCGPSRGSARSKPSAFASCASPRSGSTSSPRAAGPASATSTRSWWTGRSSCPASGWATSRTVSSATPRRSCRRATRSCRSTRSRS